MSDYVITTHGLTKKFGDFTAVSDLSMNIPRGTVHGFLGPNGSGKTTAIRMMCGLMDPTEGKVTVLGMKVPEQAKTVRLHVGYMTQKFSMYQDMTVRQNLAFLCRIHGMKAKQRKQRIEEVMEEYDLASIHNRKAGPLSGGQKRRLVAESLLQLKAQDTAVKGDGPVEISDFEMDMPDTGLRRGIEK